MVMLTFSAPSPGKVRGVLSQRHCARGFGLSQRTMSRVDKVLIEKCRQLSVDKKGIFWALAKCKKRYSTINKELWLLLITAFNDHPHIIVLLNAKNMLQVKVVDGKKVSVCKVLAQVGLGTIFFNIVHNNLTIKGKVGKHAFSASSAH